MTRIALPAWMHRVHGPSPVTRHALISVAVIGLLVVAALLWAKWGSRGEAQLERLSNDQRRALYTRTLADLELCATSSGVALGEHCARQAAFIVRFSECDASCKNLANGWLSRPSR